MVESGGLENRCALIRTEGSNPSLSAQSRNPRFMRGFLLCCKAGISTRAEGSTHANRHEDGEQCESAPDAIGGKRSESILPFLHNKENLQYVGVFFVYSKKHKIDN